MKLFRKTGVSTLINIIGMSVAFAAATILLVQVRWDTAYDRNFTGHEQVFRMENNWLDDGLFSTYFNRPMVEVVRTASPNIEAVGTIHGSGNTVYYREGEKESSVAIPSVSADSTFFAVFPFEWAEGSLKDFAAAGTVVISETYAALLYGKESAVGKVLQTHDGESWRIAGVFRDPARNSSLSFGLIRNLGDWCLTENSEWSFPAFVKMKDPAQAEETLALMRDVYQGCFGENLPADEAESIRSGFRLVGLHDAHYERDVKAYVPSVNKSVTVTLAVVALLLILIAIINFINFAFAEIPFRIKSINTRKVLGASRASLVGRQLLTAGLLALAAFGLSCLLVHAAAGTSLASFVSDSLALKDILPVLSVILGGTLVSAVVAGIAPALYSTSRPAAFALKGAYGTSPQGRALRNVLVALQFVLSFLFILMALYVRVQTRYMIRKDMGFTQENILQVGCGPRATAQKDALKDRLLQNPAIREVTFSDNMLVSNEKMGWGRTGDDGKSIYMEVLPVADNFLDFFGLQIVEGRDFRESDNQSDVGCFIANERFFVHFPQYRVGSLIEGHAGPAEIVGKVRDFNFKSLQHPIVPLMFVNWEKSGWRWFSVLYVKTVPGADFREVSRYVREAVCAFDPMMEPDQVSVRHLDEWIRSMYTDEEALGGLITAASLIALLIAVIGIIGLVFFETQFMKKEIAVRRVNGASVEGILWMINRKYLIMAGLSFVLAAPFAYWLMTFWRKGFAYQAPVPAWIFLAAPALVAAVVLLVVTVQSWRAANANPVESLKKE